jgi:hypothetical protein
MELNIQLFASTNKTANYELPQFVGTDKPTWLGDFNSAMADIDAGMHENASDISAMASDVATATSTASQASQAVSSLTSTVNTLSTNVQSATTTANNASSTASSALNTANTANGKADTNATAISSLDERVTQTEADIADINLTTFETITTSDITQTGNGTIGSNMDLRVAKNSDGSIAKIYGGMDIDNIANGNVMIQTSLRPESAITINGCCLRVISKGASVYNIGIASMTIDTNGVVTVSKVFVNSTNTERNRFIFIPCLLFIKEFGDTPITNGE